MKMKALLFTLCFCCGLQSTVCAQPSEDKSQQSKGNSEFRIQNSGIHLAPPRKEIRHKLKQWPQDNGLQQTATRATGDYLYKEFPTTGDLNIVVILVAFADVSFSMDDISINRLLSNRLNADDYSEVVDLEAYAEALYGESFPLSYTIPGSARDYFRDQSFGQFSPSFDVIGPVTLSQKRSYYGGNDANGNDKNTSAMIREACQIAYDKGLTDFKDYDRDGNKVVDCVCVIYAGGDESQTGIDEAIWSKSSNVSYTLENGNGTKIGRYACAGELFFGLPVVGGIGTFVHEFSHVLGLPDFYDTSGADDRLTMDMWSVMDYGMYNADGFVPCAYTAFERYSLGWLPMYTLDAPATGVIGTTEKEKKGYRAFVSEADTASFYLFETIRWEDWNSYAPAEGLLISEVSYQKSAWTGNQVNVGKHRYSIVPANDWWRFPPNNNVNMPEYYPPSHLFGNTNHEFSKDSSPKSVTQFGKVMDKPLTEIYYDTDEGVTRFQFCGGGERVGVDNPQIDNSVLIYDLLGRPVVHPTKGIYIVNGKKTIIK